MEQLQKIATGKVAIVGSKRCGKTGLFMRMTEDVFPQDNSFVGTDFKFAYRQHQGRSIRICIWDTFSQEGYRPAAVSYYNNVDVVLLCFDLSNRLSYDGLQRWYDEIMLQAPKEATIFLIGLKQDLQPTVGTQEVNQWIKQHPNIKAYFTCSAKTEDGIDEIVEAVLGECQSRLNPQEAGGQEQQQPLADDIIIPIMKEGMKKGWCPIF